MLLQIDKELMQLKLLYFFELAFFSSIIMYQSQFMVGWGVTVTELAIINFIANMVTFLTRPLFGYFADKYQNYREIIIITTFTCSVAFLLHLASPKYVKSIVDYSLKNNFSVSEITNDNLISICYINNSINICWPTILNNCSKQFNSGNDYQFYQNNQSCGIYQQININKSLIADNNNSSIFRCLNIIENCTNNPFVAFNVWHHDIGLTWSSTFWILGFLKIIAYSIFSPLSNLTDSLIFIILGKERSHEYGLTRMFGTIGVLVFAIVTGVIMYGLDLLSISYKWNWLVQMQSFSQFTICFILQMIVALAVIIIVIFLRNDKTLQEKKLIRIQTCVSKVVEIMSIKLVCQDLEMAIFFIFSIFGGVILAVHAEYYVIIIYKLFPGAPKYFPGVLVAIMTLSEVIIMGISSRVFKLFRYEFWVSLTFGFWCLRWLTYSFCSKYWHFLIIEIIHGTTFGMQFCAMLSFIGQKVSQSNQGRVQGLFSGLFFNIGGGLGGFSGGIILDQFGTHGLFRSMAVTSLIFSILYYPLQVCIVARKCKTNNSTQCIEIETNNQLLVNQENNIDS